MRKIEFNDFMNLKPGEYIYRLDDYDFTVLYYIGTFVSSYKGQICVFRNIDEELFKIQLNRYEDIYYIGEGDLKFMGEVLVENYNKKIENLNKHIENTKRIYFK